jgi:hypothetical protein
LPYPDRKAEHEDIGGEYLAPQFRPVIAFPLVGQHSRLDVEVGRADRGRGLHSMSGKSIKKLSQDAIRRGFLLVPGGLERAVERK